jgi:heterodisulfide reductase subunit B
MKELAFYPGCALQSMTWDYRESIKHVARALDIGLMELEDWTCCGATAAHSLDEQMSLMLPARNLASAEKLGKNLAVACPLCYKRLSLCQQTLRERRGADPWSLRLDLNIFDLARFLGSDEMLERIRDQVRTPLGGLRVACYYGCQVVRSPKVTGYEDYENPRHLDRLVDNLGAAAVDWSLKTTCCGASTGIVRREIGLTLVKKLLTWAHLSGAEALMVCCPLCQSNLDLHQPELQKEWGWDWELPVFYYTELLGIALGLDTILPGLRSHMANPLPLVARILGG